MVHCPFCRNTDSRVVDTRITDDGISIRRRRECSKCKRRFSTLESPNLLVIKRSGATEQFSRQKIISGVGKACQGRPVTEDQLAVLAAKVEENVRASGSAHIKAEEIGTAILEPLKHLDLVAYLRFASVYKNYNSIEDFENEIEELRKGNSVITAI
ncbi:transcriptional regulator NrdR [Actinotignum urinale]|uniref:Transcriptional repressor NrdR n=1 Tax=Actinotignum urinale TaxID=190146 RepID=A0AAW9HMI2_9ACTO|nr:transcriptional regulator NrdR [Actinotignum urinale]MDY5132327.1 transcriptional regulator NrdR [Actinotignum urinale]MDY5151434.1 transcriptional regulator NrdR [Actinotignum urinale]MDY5154957.1 transcriptional regulator NrdR [Actinotignum urinale]MDY5160788.1 transcriptional regulator NrdR [Actinotignum urinale]